ncbi:MAG: hypothetical protein IH591_20535 [Bacteroidales bacterium]|nr:hypothetical protein [Bacteroidales bacterium]
MKNSIRIPVIMMALLAALSGCQDKKIERVTYVANVPVYMPFDQFRSSFQKSAPIEIAHPGKIYFKDGYLFVNEYGKGIHVIDNSDPASPQTIAFYEILGNIDMAIRGDMLFADSFIDLVAIDISDIQNPVEVSRLENIFPEVAPAGDMWYPYAMVDKSKGVIVDWEVRTVTEDHDSQGHWESWLFRGDFMFNSIASSVKVTGSGASSGVAGSMASFMLNEQFLYLIAQPWNLKTVDVTAAADMEVVDSIEVQRNMETLYKLEDKLFVGTTTGMLIFGLTDPAAPRQISAYDHITACDPVVVDGQYAYVTLRSGSRCANSQNLLEVIDISSISNPYLVKSYPMFNPHGLGIDGDLLFVCDGAAGLKVYDKSDPMDIINNKLAHYADFNTYDVIPLNGILMLVGEGGIYQYDYSNPLAITQISHIEIGNGD